MRLQLLAVSTLAAAVIAGCTQESVKKEVAEVKKEVKAMAKAKPKPELKMGASAKMLAETCEGCHGTGGNSFGPAIPSIAGMSEDYLIEAMEYYKSGDTQSTIMGRIMKGYTDSEIEQIAGFYASNSYIPAKQPVNQSLVAKGKKLHAQYCEDCHGDGGKNVDDDTGLLAGQWIPYLKYSFEDYQNGNRSIGKKMKKKLNAVTAKEGNGGVDALIQYYASQQ